jgi:preprotein translocase subunit YajC
VTSDQWGSLIPLLLIVAAFWFLVLRPARNRQRDAQALQRQLAEGSTVMLTSGIFGEVERLSDDAVVLRISPQVTIAAHRNAVGRILDDEEVARMRGDGILDDVPDPTTRPAD